MQRTSPTLSSGTDARVLATRPTPEDLARRNRFAGALLLPLGALLATLLLVFFVFFQTAQVVGDSMEPGLRHGDRLLVTRGYDDPVRGDVVLLRFRSPEGEETVVKRLVAHEGDEVIVRGDDVWVNGEYASIGYGTIVGGSNVATGPLTVEGARVFVLGDNRSVSLDSRFVGTVSEEVVIGRVVAVWSPVTRLRLVDRISDTD